jgi:hypothetical protein
MQDTSVRDSLLATVAGLVVGLAVHFIIVYFRDYGPSGSGFSLRGNGAIIFLLLAVVALVAGELWCYRRRAWLGMALLPVAMFLGIFVIAGGI